MLAKFWNVLAINFSGFGSYFSASIVDYSDLYPNLLMQLLKIGEQKI